MLFHLCLENSALAFFRPDLSFGVPQARKHVPYCAALRQCILCSSLNIATMLYGMCIVMMPSV